MTRKWVEEHHNFDVCSSCKERMFGKAFRLLMKPVQNGNRTVWGITPIKICQTCKKQLDRKNEKRLYLYLKRRWK